MCKKGFCKYAVWSLDRSHLWEHLSTINCAKLSCLGVANILVWAQVLRAYLKSFHFASKKVQILSLFRFRWFGVFKRDLDLYARSCLPFPFTCWDVIFKNVFAVRSRWQVWPCQARPVWLILRIGLWEMMPTTVHVGQRQPKFII